MDIFGRDINFGGAFQPEGTVVAFAGGASGAIVNNITINYEQGISRLWDLGSGDAFFVVGHTNGTFGMGNVATSSGLNYDVFGTACLPGTLLFNGEPGFCTSSAVQLLVQNTRSYERSDKPVQSGCTTRQVEKAKALSAHFGRDERLHRGDHSRCPEILSDPRDSVPSSYEEIRSWR